MKYYALDFGNGTCSLGVVEAKNGEVKVDVLKNKNGEDYIKSTLEYKSLGEVIVGKEYRCIGDSIDLAKLRLATKGKRKLLEKETSTHYCAATIMNYMTKKFSMDDDIKNIVLTIPASYGQSKRSATKQAAFQAGVDNLVNFIEEPIAAAMYHIFKQYNNNTFNFEGKNLMIFDFGSGTLDLALIKVFYEEREIKVEVLDTQGKENLGGYLIDIYTGIYILRSLVNICDLDKYRKVLNNLELYELEYSEGKYDYLDNLSQKEKLEVKKFIEYGEVIKKHVVVTLEEEVCINKVLDLNIEQDIYITKEEFRESVLEENNIFHNIKNLMNLADSKHNFVVDQIVMVGGSSRIESVRAFLQDEYGREKVIIDDEYDYAVSKGAAIFSAVKQGLAVEPFGFNYCEGLISKDVLVRIQGKEKLVIKKGTKYPNKKKVEMKVENSLCSNFNINIFERVNRVDSNIAKLSFYHPSFFTGDDIEISIDIDELGIMSFKASHHETKEDIEVEVDLEYSLSKEKLEAGRNYIKNKLTYIGE